MFARMKAPEGCTSCSWGGEIIEVVNGMIEVAAEGAQVLTGHGFELIEHFESDAEKAERAAKEEAGKAASDLSHAIELAESEIKELEAKIASEVDSDKANLLKSLLGEKTATLDAMKAKNV